MKRLPIGLSDYKKLIEENYYYVDKTLLVQEIERIGSGVFLLCRPRRFGKTLNLSMLQYFYEKTATPHDYLFHNAAIWHDEACRALQGKFPVIFISFKDVKKTNFAECYDQMISLLAKEFKRHANYLMPKLSEYDLKEYKAILEKTANSVAYANSLLFLTELLYQHYGQKTIILFDEYDTPIHAAYNNGYYKEAVSFIKDLFSAVLKDNKFLERGVLTGILRTAKEGIFSGLNNLSVRTFMSDSFADKFGFTQSEVDQLFQDQAIDYTADQIKIWYNGYRAGEHVLVYNPWSIIECAGNKGRLMPYWVNTSDNQIVKKLIIHSTPDAKKELEDLLVDSKTTKIIEEGFTFNNIESNPVALWSLLLFSGYLTYARRILTDKGNYSCDLAIPNKEIHVLFEDLIKSVLIESIRTLSVQDMLNALTTGNMDIFEPLLQEFIHNSMSMYDLSADEPEKSYHLFVLGLLVLLSDTYHVRSNRESGYGRYDIMLIPHDKHKKGVIVEFKKVDSKETFELATIRALTQIREKKYAQELQAQGINDIIAYGIACQGKKILVKAEVIS